MKLVDKGGVEPTDRSYRQPFRVHSGGHLPFLSTRKLVPELGVEPKYTFWFIAANIFMITRCLLLWLKNDCYGGLTDDFAEFEYYRLRS